MSWWHIPGDFFLWSNEILGGCSWGSRSGSRGSAGGCCSFLKSGTIAGVFGEADFVWEWSIFKVDTEGGSEYECSTLTDDKTVGWVSGEGG